MQLEQKFDQGGFFHERLDFLFYSGRRGLSDLSALPGHRRHLSVPTGGMTGGGQPCGEMDVLEKLTILTDAAKYDAACTSSGVNRQGPGGVYRQYHLLYRRVLPLLLRRRAMRDPAEGADDQPVRV